MMPWKENFKFALLLNELSSCAPYINAGVERFFNHMKYVKSNSFISLSQNNLNFILVLKLLDAKVSLKEFEDKLAYQYLDYWYYQKDYLIHQCNKINIENTMVGKAL